MSEFTTKKLSGECAHRVFCSNVSTRPSALWYLSGMNSVHSTDYFRNEVNLSLRFPMIPLPTDS